MHYYNILYKKTTIKVFITNRWSNNYHINFSKVDTITKIDDVIGFYQTHLI